VTRAVLKTTTRNGDAAHLGTEPCMPMQRKVRFLSVIEVYEDEDRTAGIMRVCTEDDDRVKRRELGRTERCLSEHNLGSPLMLSEDYEEERVWTKVRDVSTVGSRGRGRNGRRRKICWVSSFSCNAISICNEDDEILSTKARRRSLLGLIPVKISTSKLWDLRLDTQSLSSHLSDSAVRNRNKMFWMNNEHYESFRVWNIGKKLGFSFSGEEDVVIGRL